MRKRGDTTRWVQGGLTSGCSCALSSRTTIPVRASALATPATWATEPPTLVPKLRVGFR